MSKSKGECVSPISGGKLKDESILHGAREKGCLADQGLMESFLTLSLFESCIRVSRATVQ